MACQDCIRGCADCEWDFNPTCNCDHDTLEYGCHCPRSSPRYCFDCHHGRLHEVPCGRVVCARHLTWHDDTAEACAHTLKSCFNCILHQRKVRDTLVREVERNLLLGAKDRAAPVKDAPKATVVLDRLVRTGQAPMASVVLDFAGGRRDGPRRKAKLRAKKDKRGKAPRKQLVTKVFFARQVAEGRVPRTGNWVLDDDDFE